MYNLSNNLEVAEDPRHQRVMTCLDDGQGSRGSGIPENSFTKNFNFHYCISISCNCLKNVECKSKNTSVSSKEATASQIKGEKQLPDFTDFFQLISASLMETKIK